MADSPQKVIRVSSDTLYGSCEQCGAGSREGVQHQVIFVCQCEHAPFDELDRELARVECFLGVVGLHVGNVPQPRFPLCLYELPDVGRVFTKGISRWSPVIWPGLIISFAGIFRRHSDRVEVEGVLLCFGEPQHDFVAT